MNFVSIVQKCLSSFIIAFAGILMTISGLAIGFLPESHPMNRDYVGILAIMLLVLGLGTLIYSRIYFKKRVLTARAVSSIESISLATETSG